MKQFALLFRRLEEAEGTNEKLEALVEYFKLAPEADIINAIAFLSGNRPRRRVRVTDMRSWGAEAAGIPLWLFEECYENTGDLAETIALLVRGGSDGNDESLTHWIDTVIHPLHGMEPDEQKGLLISSWQSLGRDECFVFNKLISGSFRVGISAKSVVNALSFATGIDAKILTHRLMGKWQPTVQYYRSLISPESTGIDISTPYPFALAHPLDQPVADVVQPGEWLAEWKYDGIRAQLIKREGEVFLWSRGEEIINDQFPEVVAAASALPDGTVLDGELLVLSGGKPRPFADMQKRVGRKKVSGKTMKDYPVSLIAFDILECGAKDLRNLSLRERRSKLEGVTDSLEGGNIILSPRVNFTSIEDLALAREGARDRSVEGLMLKRLDSSYPTGRKRGDWWKWKVDPLTVDAVLLYAQAGHGRRAGLYTDYTFALWDHGRLVPFAKAYSGLTDAEITEVDRFVKQSTLEKFGPVRSVTPKLVFELAFEGVQPSSRHKCGVAVRFPRIVRWRRDLSVKDADSLDDLKKIANTGTLQ
mgnify:FL=1